jgi:hypothetical protein
MGLASSSLSLAGASCRKSPAADTWRSAVCLVATVLVASACGLTSAEKETIYQWLVCDECNTGELDSVDSLGNDAVGELSKTLYGPSQAELRNMRAQYSVNYARVVQQAGALAVAATEADYVAHYLGLLIAMYQSRSARALARIDTDKANDVLRDALEHSDDFGPGVLEEIRRALVRSLTISAGNNQTAVVGSVLPVNPAVVARDDRGDPVTGLSLTFTPGPNSGIVSQVVVRTDTITGTASGSWTLGTTPGAQTLVVHSGSDTVVVTATATPAPGPVLSYSTGSGQRAAAGRAVPVAAAVLVTDGAGNALAGATVTFAVTQGGGSVTGATDVSDANGIASVDAWTLGLGTNRLQASSPGAQATVEFTAEGRAADSVLISAGASQSAEVGTTVPIAPAVRVVDATGNPVQDVRVSFIVAAGGGAVVGSVDTTDSDGIAAVDSWTLGPAVRANRLRARVYEVGEVTFSATGTVGPADSMSIRSGNRQSALPGTAVAVPPSVRVFDRFGNPVPNHAVSFTPRPSSGVVAGGNASTGGDGVAAVGSWTLGPGPGPDTLVAEALRTQPVAFTAFVLPITTYIATGLGRSYAVAIGGDLYAWGSHVPGGGQSVARMIRVGGIGDVAEVAIGREHSCAVSTGGRVSCWGDNSQGQFGAAGPRESALPVPVTVGFVISSLTAGGFHTCADSAGLSVYCWGSNVSGQLGIGRFHSRSRSPQKTVGISSVGLLTAGEAHSCAATADGIAFCWHRVLLGRQRVRPTGCRRPAQP